MNNYCTKDNYANLNSDKCIRWCNLYSDDCEDAKNKYCNNPANIGTTLCKDWITTAGVLESQNVNFDSAVMSYCDSNPDDSICTCIKSPFAKLNDNSKANPYCWDGACQLSGYPTSGMRNQSCPDIVDCSIVFDLDANEAILENVKIQQECGNEIASHELTEAQAQLTTSSQPDPEDGSSSTFKEEPNDTIIKQKPPDPSFFSKYKYYLIGGGVLFFMFIIFIIIVIIIIAVASSGEGFSPSQVFEMFSSFG